MNGYARLKVVHAIRSDGFAGVERYVSTVAAALAGRGHSLVVVGGDPDRMVDALGSSLVEFRPAARTFDVTRQLARVARHTDIVHVHMTAAEFGAAMANPVLRVPIVATRHFTGASGSTAVVRLARSVVRRRLRGQISISDFVASTLGEPSVTIRNAVPNADGIDPSERVVLVAQRLEPEKRTLDALNGWSASNLAADGWILRIAGDGSEREMLERAAIDRELQAVEFLGHRGDLPELRRSAGLLLATAPREPFGLSVAEAMAAGLPVVAAGSGGHIETVGAARPDLLYAPADPVDLARRVRFLADDPEARRRAGRDLRAFQRHELNLDHHVDALIDFYRTLLPRRSERSAIR